MNRLQKMYELGEEKTVQYVDDYFKKYSDIRCRLYMDDTEDYIVIREPIGFSAEDMSDFINFFNCPFNIQCGYAHETKSIYVEITFYIHDWVYQVFTENGEMNV